MNEVIKLNYPIHSTWEEALDKDDYIRIDVDITIDRNSPKSIGEISNKLNKILNDINSFYST